MKRRKAAHQESAFDKLNLKDVERLSQKREQELQPIGCRWNEGQFCYNPPKGPFPLTGGNKCQVMIPYIIQMFVSGLPAPPYIFS